MSDSEEQRLERIKRIDRILDGNSGDDMIAKLLDVENPLERTLSPNIGFVLFNVYLRHGAERFGADKGPGSKLKLLADNFASAMISYKDKRMDHIQEIMKKAPENVTVQASQPLQQQPEKRSVFSRKPKEEFE